MAALTQLQALSILSDSDLANIFAETSFYNVCSVGLRSGHGLNVRKIVERRLAKGTIQDCPLIVVLNQFFDGDPMNVDVQQAIVSLYFQLGLLHIDTYNFLSTAISE